MSTVRSNIEFDQLLQIVKNLPESKLKQLKAEIENESKAPGYNIDLEDLLLKGPVATQK